MNLYPAIDLYDGKVVRLNRGEFQKIKIYSEKPEEVARQWESQGTQWLHVVDLEGAKTGVLKNLDCLKKIRKTIKAKIEFGGGLRDIDSIASLTDEGIDRCVLGTKALDNTFIQDAVKKFGAKIAVGLDVKEGIVQVQGWLEASDQTLETAIQKLNHFAVETIIYTDIQKDGMLEGPNWEGLKKVLELSRARVILSGGVSSLRDIHASRQIRQPNFEGMIIGKALYEKRFSVAEAMAILKIPVSH